MFERKAHAQDASLKALLVRAACVVAAVLALGAPAYAAGSYSIGSGQNPPVGTPVGMTVCPDPTTGVVSSCAGGGGGSTPFTPSASGSRMAQLSVTTSDSSGPLPTGAANIIYNTDTTNPIYCNEVGATATTADAKIPTNSWAEFAPASGITTLHCIATGGTVLANGLGGSGLATGAGGGGGGGGGGGAITAASGSYAAGALSSGAVVDLLPLNSAQGATTSGLKGPLVQCSVTTANPTYTTGQTDPVNCDTAGNIRVNVTAGSLTLTGSIPNIPTAPTAGAGTGTALCDLAIKATATACGSSAAHNVMNLSLDNTANAAASYVEVFNLATGSVTPGTTAALHNFAIPANGVSNVSFEIPEGYSTAVTFVAATARNGGTGPSSNVGITVEGN